MTFVGPSVETIALVASVLIAIGALGTAVILWLRWPGAARNGRFSSSFLEQEERARRHRYAQLLPLTLATAAIAMLSAVALAHLPRLRELALTAIIQALSDVKTDNRAGMQDLQKEIGNTQKQIVETNRLLAGILESLPPKQSAMAAIRLPGAASFPSGGACESVPRKELDEEIKPIVDAIEAAAATQHLVGVLVLGQHDVRALSTKTRAQFGDNSALAYRRARCVEAALRDLLPDDIEHGMMMLSLIAGPEHPGAKRDAKELEQDRQAYAMMIATGA